MARKPDKGRAASRPAGLSDEDAALFDEAMKDVAAIRGRMETAPPPEPLPPVAPTAKDSAGLQPRPRSVPGPSPRAKLANLAPGESGDVDSRTLDRLRRGRLRPSARIDLHGMTQAEAHRTLDSFVGQAHASGARCVIVITGKGRVSEGGGVLRNQVPHWLNSPTIRPRILAFAPAQPRDGGTGALYVLLRRRR